jgi:hypothetical protein
MPIVFVHGVNVRDKSAVTSLGNQKTFFANQLRRAFVPYAPADVDVRTPYWGDLGAQFPRNMCFLPRNGIQALALGDSDEVSQAEAIARAFIPAEDPQTWTDNPLLLLAQEHSLGAAIDVLFDVGAMTPLSAALITEDERIAIDEDAAAFGQSTAEYLERNPRPSWILGLGSDDEFLSRLIQEVRSSSQGLDDSAGVVETLGLGDNVATWLRNAAKGLERGLKQVVEQGWEGIWSGIRLDTRSAYLLASRYARPIVSEQVGRFLGDIFAYLKNRADIASRVLGAIDSATEDSANGDQKLFLVGHSFGGLILYDILTSFRSDLDCEVLVTVGSQVALFGELDCLAANETVADALRQPKEKARRPNGVRRWLNIYDPTDFIGFAVEGLFEGAWDFTYETDALPLLSHSAYFSSPRFFSRMHHRVAQSFAFPNTDGKKPE